MKLQNKVALITGTSPNIGGEVCTDTAEVVASANLVDDLKQDDVPTALHVW